MKEFNQFEINFSKFPKEEKYLYFFISYFPWYKNIFEINQLSLDCKTRRTRKTKTLENDIQIDCWPTFFSTRLFKISTIFLPMYISLLLMFLNEINRIVSLKRTYHSRSETLFRMSHVVVDECDQINVYERAKLWRIIGQRSDMDVITCLVSWATVSNWKARIFHIFRGRGWINVEWQWPTRRRNGTSPVVLLLDELETINKNPSAARDCSKWTRAEADVGASSPRNSSYHLAKEV